MLDREFYKICEITEELVIESTHSLELLNAIYNDYKKKIIDYENL